MAEQKFINIPINSIYRNDNANNANPDYGEEAIGILNRDGLIRGKYLFLNWDFNPGSYQN